LGFEAKIILVYAYLKTLNIKICIILSNYLDFLIGLQRGKAGVNKHDGTQTIFFTYYMFVLMTLCPLFSLKNAFLRRLDYDL
jgi:hypothetical protein